MWGQIINGLRSFEKYFFCWKYKTGSQVYPIFSIKIYIANLHIFPITFGFRFAELNTIVLFQMTQQLYNTPKVRSSMVGVSVINWLCFKIVRLSLQFPLAE